MAWSTSPGMIPLPGESFEDEARSRGRDQQGEWMSRARDDRFFPAPFMRRQIRDRLGIEPVEISGGHYVQLTAPAAARD